ncbi:DinB family protein [Lysinibacillus sp. FSL R7-0073]|uniref:DltD domain-containing protein n=1 Tax=Lysinibacillus fusiformis TaxID=28031 RepID=A0A1E4RA94_9BACI|nr:DinB family protein [Lysinibacillus fusiformis]HBJ02008.1 DinB family protein [Lysinibacillus sp.]MCR8852879.1 DinB family protein [Lysinibacillus fusiformis]MED4888758.1 DinB family protein [Lysinibacillus fusiformis]ODV57349.1 DltD domain-containing protein [Lysinibacillus fusiformis]WKT75668.1 DinB family protein [Lysinibacillus fusiformis]
MMDAKTILLDQLLANANDRSWYMSFHEVVEGLSEEEAFWKPDESSHSIAEIVQHLIYWNETWQIRYKENHVQASPQVKSNDDTFLLRDEVTFLELKDKLLKTLLQWQELLEEEQLLSVVNGYPVKAEWWAIISNAATHNAYHIGQLAYIRKMKR